MYHIDTTIRSYDVVINYARKDLRQSKAIKRHFSGNNVAINGYGEIFKHNLYNPDVTFSHNGVCNTYANDTSS